MLFTLSSDELYLEQSRLQALLLQAQLRVRAARWAADANKLGEANSDLQCLSDQLGEVQLQLDKCSIRAATSEYSWLGRVADLNGVIVKKGQELGELGSEGSKRVKVSAGQWESSRITANRWSRSSVALSRPIVSTLTLCDARLTTQLPDESMRADAGGQLPLEVKADGTLSLIEQRATAYVALTPQQSLSFAAGQRVGVLLDCERQCLGSRLRQLLSSYFFTLTEN